MLHESEIRDVISKLDITKPLGYKYLWIAKVQNYFQHNVIVSVAKTSSSEVRGLLIVSFSHLESRSTKDIFSPPKYVELKAWLDTVKSGMQSVNLLNEEDDWVSDDQWWQYYFDLYVATYKLKVNLTYGPRVINNTNMQGVWKGILSAIDAIARSYDSGELYNYVSPPIDFDG